MSNILRQWIKILLAIIIVSSMQSCALFKSKSKTNQPDKVTERPTTLKETAKDYLKTAIIYSTFDGKAKADYDDGSINQSVEMQVKSVYGEKSWVGVRAGMFGITTEVITALAEPSAVKAVNKWDGVYYEYTFAEASRLLNAPLDFPTLQNLLIGNPLFTDGKITSFKVADNKAIIQMEKDGFVQTLAYSQQSHLLENLHIKNETRGFDCTIVYANYNLIEGDIQFSMQRKIQFNLNGKTTHLDLEYKSAQFNKGVDIKFSIPKTYRQVK